MMTLDDWLSVSTIFIAGMWVGFVIRDRFPATTRHHMLSGSLVMSAAAIGAITSLADLDSFAVNVTARMLAMILACSGLIAAMFGSWNSPGSA